MGHEQNANPPIPFPLLYEQAEKDIFYAVNKSAESIPFYLLDGILTNILHQVRDKAKEERENAARLYEKQLAEYGEAKKEDNNG